MDPCRDPDVLAHYRLEQAAGLLGYYRRPKKERPRFQIVFLFLATTVMLVTNAEQVSFPGANHWRPVTQAMDQKHQEMQEEQDVGESAVASGARTKIQVFEKAWSCPERCFFGKTKCASV